MTRKSRTEGRSGAPGNGAPEDQSHEPLVLKDLLEFPASVLAPVPVGMSPDHLLLESVRGDDITLTVKCPDPQASPRDVLQLLVDKVETGAEVPVDPYLPDKDVPLVLPAIVRMEGLRELNYKIKYLSGGGDEEELGPAGQQFIADYTAPGGDELPTLRFAPDVIADGITPDKLTAAPGGDEYLPSELLPYLGKAWGDLVQALIDDTPVGTALEIPEDLAPVVELPFPRAALEAAGDGPHDFCCTVTDRAGNRATVLAVELTIRLEDFSPDLQPPTIAGDNDIDPTEFVSPVATLIPHLAIDGSPVFAAGDEVQLFITDVGGVTRDPVNATPVVIAVPTDDVDTIEVPVAKLVAGLMYFQYSVSRTFAGGNPVTAWSPVQPVNTRSPVDLPGGAQPLPLTMHIFRDSDKTRGGPVRPSYDVVRVGDILNGQPSPYAGMTVRIHHYDNMKEGDRIDLKLEGSHTFPDYGAPSPDVTFELSETVSSTHMRPRPTVIPEDVILGTNPPANEPGQFVDFRIPYSDLLKLQAGSAAGRGTMRASYTITSDVGSNSSDPAVVLFATLDVRSP